jgi:beta-1,4-mannosyl-glycoprotein beta-1,4-N-acetylglucosaminyltransferase
LKNTSIDQIRENTEREEQLTGSIITNGGWHFSFMGGEEMVRTKITSYSARDLANEQVLSNIKNNIENDQDVFFRGKLTKVELDNTFPQYVLNNLSKYSKMIKA